MENRTQKSHGGARPGAGRRKGEPTVFMRLPESLEPTVRALIAARAYSHPVLVPRPNALRVERPLYGHKVKAGFLSPADDDVEALLDLNEHLIEHKEATFFVRASGDSMVGAGIQDGSLLVVDRALDAQHGDIVIAAVDGELTVKRLEKRRGRVRLLAETPGYPPIAFQDGQELVIWGVVVSVIQKLRSPSPM